MLSTTFRNKVSIQVIKKKIVSENLLLSQKLGMVYSLESRFINNTSVQFDINNKYYLSNPLFYVNAAKNSYFKTRTEYIRILCVKAKISYEHFERVVVEWLRRRSSDSKYTRIYRSRPLIKQLIILFPYKAIKYNCYFNDDSVEILKIEKSYNWLSECSFLDIQVL